MTLLLNKADVAKLLTMDEAIASVEAGFREFALGHVMMPQRTAIKIAEHGGLHLGMPAYIGGNFDALGLKVVTVYAGNPSKFGLPTTIGVLLLSDPKTGAPLAIMDAGYMTALRTGAASGVATKYLAKPDARTIGVFGAGVQAQTQLWAACTVRKIESAHVYDVDRERAAAFSKQMSERLKIRVTPVETPRAAVDGMDIVALASTSPTPILDGNWLQPGQHINGVGAHTANARELDTIAVLRSTVVADHIDACLAEAGEFIIPIKEGAMTKDHIRAGLGEIVAGMKPGRTSPDEITLYKSVGLAIQDVSTASLVYSKATQYKAGVEFEF